MARSATTTGVFGNDVAAFGNDGASLICSIAQAHATQRFIRVAAWCASQDTHGSSSNNLEGR
jgi:hypothetical protein